MATINSQSLKYKLKKKMAAVFDHFRNFQPCTSICTKMTNDKKKPAMWSGVNASLIYGFSH